MSTSKITAATPKFDRANDTLLKGRVSEVWMYEELKPFSFIWPCSTSNQYEYRVTVPKGFIHDYATIPPIATKLTGLKPDDPDYAQAAILHDFLCRFRKKSLCTKEGRVVQMLDISRKECDDIFLDAMKSLNCPPWKYNLIYAAVRAYAVVNMKK